MSFEQWLAMATKSLQTSDISTARLDALVLLSHVTRLGKAQILARPEAMLPKNQRIRIDALLARRAQHEPIAYITGTKEFYGREFAVTTDVLVPRPESESFIDLLKKHPPTKSQSLLDIGTGSGILAISAKKEFPALAVYATDVSDQALEVAKHNATNHHTKIHFVQSDLFANVTGTFDYIFANLPYVPTTLTVSREVQAEPSLAVFSGADGLDHIRRFVSQVPTYCAAGAYICIESLLSQHADIAAICRTHAMTLTGTHGLVQLFRVD